MMRPNCMVEGCTRESRARGMCNRHYENVRLRGSPVPVRELPIEDRLGLVGWDVTESGCWEWRGARNWCGYGIYDSQRVHRLMLSLRGVDVEDWVVRHHCDNPPCVNPDHLAIGTQADNSRDMVSRGRHSMQRRRECSRGHDLTAPGATREYADRSNCVECRHLRDRRYQARRAAA